MRVLFTTGRDSTGVREVLAEWRPVVDEELERILPRRFDDAYLDGTFGEAAFEYDADAVEVTLATPTWELLDPGGKRWRGRRVR